MVLHCNRRIGAREPRQLIPHVRFQVPFLGPEKSIENQASHVRASSVIAVNFATQSKFATFCSSFIFAPQFNSMGSIVARIRVGVEMIRRVFVAKSLKLVRAASTG